MKPLTFLIRLLYIPILMVFMGVVSCQYDDTDVKNQIDDLYGRLDELEEFQEQVQSDIDALNDIVTKLQAQLTVNGIFDIGEYGWVINFSDRTKVIISHGKDGADGEDGKDGKDGKTPPTIIVINDNGTYYWGYEDADGDRRYLLDDNGDRVPVQGEAPKVRINPNTGNWEISTDGGRTWEDTGMPSAGGAGDSMFAGVDEDDDFVYITLRDGTTITIPKTKELMFDFGVEDEILYFDAGETKVLDYVMSGAKDMTIAKPTGWRASFEAEGLVITAPVAENPFAEMEGEINVVIVSAGGQSLMDVLHVAVDMGIPSEGPKIGDYYYADGTWSDGGLVSIDEDGLNPVWAEVKPAPVEGKQVIGIVFQTFEDRIDAADKAAGWTHGYVMAVRNAHGTSKNTTSYCLDYSLDCIDGVNLASSWYKNIDGYSETMTVKSEYGSDIVQCPAFDWTVTDFPLPTPDGTSGWFLPATGNMWDLIANLGGHDVAAIMQEWQTQDVSAGWGYVAGVVDYNILDRINSTMSLIPADQKEEFFETYTYGGGYASVWTSTPCVIGETACTFQIGAAGSITTYEAWYDEDCIARPILAF